MAQNIKKLQVVFPAGKVLFDEGERTKEMFILLKGCVEVYKGGNLLASINASGSFIGEMATLLNAPRTAMVKTKEKSVMLKVEPEDVDVLFKVTPELGYNLSKSLAERLVMMTEKAMSMKSGSAGAPEKPDAQQTETKETLSKDQISNAEKEMKDEKEAPQSMEDIVQFLTRTEVHKDVMRYYFNFIGSTQPLSQIIDSLLCPEMLVKLILAEYKKSGFIKVEGDTVEYLFVEEAQDIIENWIFQHGLFRFAS